MAEQTPSGFIPRNNETPDVIKGLLKKRVSKTNPDIPVADNVARWSSDKSKQFTPQDVPKRPLSSPTDKVGKVKTYLIDKYKKGRTKPETLPLEMGLQKRNVSTNPLKEFKYSFYDGKQVMR